ncbi:hypothetical protein M405DRAFT_143842 [Rhizopogon salebrosus TDB-379]|nr:hypothetical protein M405DRAFT_143842 [Rhizopogon salebrosus TDB-379]
MYVIDLNENHRICWRELLSVMATLETILIYLAEPFYIFSLQYLAAASSGAISTSEGVLHTFPTPHDFQFTPLTISDVHA